MKPRFGFPWAACLFKLAIVSLRSDRFIHIHHRSAQVEPELLCCRLQADRNDDNSFLYVLLCLVPSWVTHVVFYAQGLVAAVDQPHGASSSNGTHKCLTMPYLWNDIICFSGFARLV